MSFKLIKLNSSSYESFEVNRENIEEDYCLFIGSNCELPEDKTYDDLFEAHKFIIENKSMWFNSTNSYVLRGTPYHKIKNESIVANCGLSLDKTEISRERLIKEDESFSNSIVPNGSLFSFSFRNTLMKTEYAKYFISDPDLYFSDLWSGFVYKKIFDDLKLNVSCGTPYIANAYDNMNFKEEAQQIFDNEVFLEVISDVRVDGDSFSEKFLSIARYISLIENENIFKFGQKMQEVYEELHKVKVGV